MYYDAGRLPEAQQNFAEALEIYRGMAKNNPGAHLPDVAATLNSLANLYGRTGRVQDAEQTFREALTIRWALAKENPDVYQQQVSATLHDWAKMYSDTKTDKPVPKN
jgi:pentatricopeptide repeat protein